MGCRPWLSSDPLSGSSCLHPYTTTRNVGLGNLEHVSRASKDEGLFPINFHMISVSRRVECVADCLQQ